MRNILSSMQDSCWEQVEDASGSAKIYFAERLVMTNMQGLLCLAGSRFGADRLCCSVSAILEQRTLVNSSAQ